MTLMQFLRLAIDPIDIAGVGVLGDEQPPSSRRKVLRTGKHARGRQHPDGSGERRAKR